MNITLNLTTVEAATISSALRRAKERAQARVTELEANGDGDRAYWVKHDVRDLIKLLAKIDAAYGQISAGATGG